MVTHLHKNRNDDHQYHMVNKWKDSLHQSMELAEQLEEKPAYLYGI
jgi:hypothetical protein